MFAGRPMKDWVDDIAPKAGIVVAIGDCATWGGLPAVPPNPSDSRGLQFDRGGKRGRLPRPRLHQPDWACRSSTSRAARRTRTGSRQVIVALASGRAGDLALDELQRPSTFFTSFTQTGCTRVQFFTYKQDPPSFGQGMRTGCLFYEFGCRGPDDPLAVQPHPVEPAVVQDPRGHPCTGCTEPGYPHGDLELGTVFKTQKVAGVIPKDEPAGMDRARYMALAGAVARRGTEVVQGGHVRRLTGPPTRAPSPPHRSPPHPRPEPRTHRRST